MLTKYPALQNWIFNIIVLLAMAAIAAPFPILTPLILYSSPLVVHNFYLSTNFLLGLVLFAYPIGQIIGGILFGSLSDKFATKQLLSISFIAMLITNILTIMIIYKQIFYLLVLIRLLNGILQSNIVPLLSHISKQNQTIKLQLFGRINSFINAGFLFGTFLGGLSNKPSIPFFIASVFCLICVIIIMMTFNNCAIKEVKLRVEKSKSTKYSPILIISLFSYMLFYAGVDGFYQYFPLFVTSSLSLSVSHIALFIIIIGISSMIASSFIHKFLSNTSQKKLLLFLLLVLTFSLFLLYALLSVISTYFLSFSIGIAIGAITPLFMTIISNHVVKNHSLLMGMLISLRRSADASITLVLAFTVINNHATPMFVSSLCILSTMVLFLLISAFNKEGYQHVSQ